MSNRFSFTKKSSRDENENIYKYVLSRLDVFPRYIFLRRLKSKDTIEEANQIKEIYLTFDSPQILHCDKVLECQGILLLIHLLTGQ